MTILPQNSHSHRVGDTCKLIVGAMQIQQRTTYCIAVALIIDFLSYIFRQWVIPRG